MASPAPPWRVDIRRTASRAHRNAPVMLIANTRSKRAASISSRRACLSRMPALFTRAWIAPSFAASPKRRTTSDSLAMSPATAFALPPEL